MTINYHHQAAVIQEAITGLLETFSDVCPRLRQFRITFYTPKHRISEPAVLFLTRHDVATGNASSNQDRWGSVNDSFEIQLIARLQAHTEV